MDGVRRARLMTFRVQKCTKEVKWTLETTLLVDDNVMNAQNKKDFVKVGKYIWYYLQGKETKDECEQN